ncbi:MAG TPA: hypothetical protein DCQ06_13990, partial [Myxococcales bacterium]|nr:hypothetical protein [Myxococcales bacterium]
GASVLQAASRVVPQLWSALRIAAVTTTVAFLSLTVFDFRGFSQFGLIAGVGVLLALISTMALFPPLVVALDRIWPEGDVAAHRSRGVRVFGIFARPKVARWTLGLAMVAAVAGAIAAPQLSFDTNFRKLRTPAKAKKQAAKETAAQQLGNKYNNRAEKRTASPIMVLTDTIADAAVVHEQLREKRDEFSRIDHFVSIHSFVPSGQAEKIPIIRRIRTKLSDKMQVLSAQERVEAKRALTMLPAQTFGATDLPDFVRKRFLDVSGHLGRYVLLYANGNLADARSVQEVVEQVGIFEVGRRKYRATASFFILAEADQIVRQEGPWAVLLAALAVLLIIGWHYRSVHLVLVSFTPLAVAFVAFLGLAAVTGLELNLFSISVLPSIFGIGIDGTVRLVHRASEVGPRGDLGAVLRQVGGAAWIASVTTAVGFGALWFQANPGLQTIGSMAVVGILVVCTFANVMVGSWLAVAPVRGITPEASLGSSVDS